jgi:peptidoglycan/LPS O-acetylase OafA/YrhL
LVNFYDCNETDIKRRWLKILKIFAYGYLSFVIYYILLQIASGGSVLEWIMANYNAKTIIKYIVFCTIDFAIPLWYLIAMIETYMFWYFVVKYGKEHSIVKLLPALFLFRIVLTMVCETNDFAWFWKINFVSCALTWFTLGYYLHGMGSDMVKNVSGRYLTIIAILGCTVMLIPIVFNTQVKFSCIGVVLYSVSLFALALKNYDKSICGLIDFIGDKLSLNVYIFHVIISGVITLVFKHILKINTGGCFYG